MFILRLAFWVAVVALVLPAAPDNPTGDASFISANAGGAPASKFEAGDAVAIAMATGSDVMGFCDRNGAVCDAARGAGNHILRQVVYYGGLAIDWAETAADDARASQAHSQAEALGV